MTAYAQLQDMKISKEKLLNKTTSHEPEFTEALGLLVDDINANKEINKFGIIAFMHQLHNRMNVREKIYKFVKNKNMFPKVIKLILSLISLGYAIYQFTDNYIGNGVLFVILSGMFILVYFKNEIIFLSFLFPVSSLSSLVVLLVSSLSPLSTLFVPRGHRGVAGEQHPRLRKPSPRRWGTLPRCILGGGWENITTSRQG